MEKKKFRRKFCYGKTYHKWEYSGDCCPRCDYTERCCKNCTVCEGLNENGKWEVVSF